MTDAPDEPKPYPESALLDEQRRAFVLNCIGQAASEIDAQGLSQMVLDIAETLKTGAMPPKRRGNLKPVS